MAHTRNHLLLKLQLQQSNSKCKCVDATFVLAFKLMVWALIDFETNIYSVTSNSVFTDSKLKHLK